MYIVYTHTHTHTDVGIYKNIHFYMCDTPRAIPHPSLNEVFLHLNTSPLENIDYYFIL